MQLKTNCTKIISQNQSLSVYIFSPKPFRCIFVHFCPPFCSPWEGKGEGGASGGQMVGDSMGGAPCCGCVSGLGKAPVTLGLEKCHWLTPVGVGFLPKSSIFFFTSHWNYWMIFCWIWNRVTPPRGPNWRLEYSGCLEKGDLSKRTWNWKTKKIHQLGKIDLFALASPIPTHFTHFRPISAPWKRKFMSQPTFQNA